MGERQKTFKKLLESNTPIKLLETHSPLCGIIVETKKFQGMWSSGLCDSSLKGLPDNEILSIQSRLESIDSIMAVTSKPILMDLDTGGKIEHLKINLKNLDKRDIAGAIIEDKAGYKRNSLYGNVSDQCQESTERFCQKISAGKSVVGKTFVLIARIESLILGQTVEHALIRSDAYVQAGADGIMIHHCEQDAFPILEFAKAFKKKHRKIPLVAVPTIFNRIQDKKLFDAGYNIIIYANQMLRASYNAMNNVADRILKDGCTHQIDKSLIGVRELLSKIPGNDN
jgi:phosphoenolpyruvate phosphomutase